MEEDERESGVKENPVVTLWRELPARLIDLICGAVFFRLTPAPVPRPRLADIVLIAIEQKLCNAGMLIIRGGLAVLDLFPARLSVKFLDGLIALKQKFLR